MARSIVSLKSRKGHVLAARISIAGLAFCAMPLFAQTSHAHDDHAMHAPAMKKPEAKDSKGKKEPTADLHGDHAMGEESSRKDDAKKNDAKENDAKGDDAKGDDAKGDDARGDDAKGDDARGDDADHSADHGDHAGMDHGEHQGMDHAAMSDVDMSAMDHSKHQGIDHSAMTDGDMAGMDHGMMNMQGGSAPPDARDPDYSNGVEPAHMHGVHMHGATYLGSVIINQLEAFNGDGDSGQAIDMQAWYGGDLDKLWLKAESERSDGRLGSTRIEALWNHAYAPYWGAQVGIRHDVGEGPSRDWVAFGVQGIAPYWFEMEATAYVGESGRTALRLEAEYELMLTQRWVLQPDAEVNFYGKDDPARGIGSGLSEFEFGLRLRYEFTRKFAPYVGVNWSRSFAKTADFARDEGGGREETQLVAGLRLWF